MAARLLRIKVQMLLPRHGDEEEWERDRQLLGGDVAGQQVVQRQPQIGDEREADQHEDRDPDNELGEAQRGASRHRAPCALGDSARIHMSGPVP